MSASVGCVAVARVVSADDARSSHGRSPLRGMTSTALPYASARLLSWASPVLGRSLPVPIAGSAPRTTNSRRALQSITDPRRLPLPTYGLHHRPEGLPPWGPCRTSRRLTLRRGDCVSDSPWMRKRPRHPGRIMRADTDRGKGQSRKKSQRNMEHAFTATFAFVHKSPTSVHSLWRTPRLACVPPKPKK